MKSKELFSAQQARASVDNYKKQLVSKYSNILDSILKNIKERAENGYYFLQYQVTISDKMEKVDRDKVAHLIADRLRALEYEVKISSEFRAAYHAFIPTLTITWGE
jgi:hypothetical protein